MNIASLYKQRFLFVLILLITGMSVSAVCIFILYQSHVQTWEKRIDKEAVMWVHFIQSLGKLNKQNNRVNDKDADNAILIQVKEAISQLYTHRSNEEMLLAVRQNETIHFILRSHNLIHNDTVPVDVPFDSNLGEPMRRALMGETGILTGLDYSGKRVLAAYRPAPTLGAALVIKIDKTIITEPFIQAALFASLADILVVAVFTIIFFRLTGRMTDDLQSSNENFRGETKKRQNLEDLLFESKQMVQTILDTLPARVFWKDLNLNYLGCNMAFAHDAGFDHPKELIGRTDLEMKWKHHAEGYRRDDRTVIESGQSKLQFQEEITLANGTHQWLSTSKVPLKDARGNIIGILGIFENITEMKFAQDQLKISEEKYRSIFEGETYAFFLLDRRSKKIEDVNDSAIKLFGYSRKEFLNLKMTDLSAQPEKTKQSIDSLATRKSLRVQTRHYKKKDGTVFPVEIIASRLLLNEEEKVFGALRDISERKKIESQMITLNQAIEQSSSSIVITSPSGKIEYVNPYFCDQTGYSFEECIGKNPNILRSGEHQPEFYKDLWDTILAGKTWRGEIKNKTKNGDFYWEEAIISPVQANGKIKHFIGIKKNITTDKEKTERLEAVQQQLMSAEKLAAIGQLAAGVSHEVLNPVNIISVLTQLLERKRKDDPALQEFCQKTRNEITRINKILSGLLTFARTGDSVKAPINIQQAVDEVIQLVQRDFELDNIQVECPGLTQELKVFADKDQLRQVFLNLVHNARHAMPNGGTLTLTVQPIQIDKADWVKVSIADTGTGINKQNMDKLFLPFFTTKPEGKGTGMGLALAHGIIRDHGGDLTVESEEGKGTTFTIIFPNSLNYCPKIGSK